MSGGQATNTSNCSPVDAGPCDDCPNQSEPLLTPKSVLIWEYSTLDANGLDERLERLGLEMSGDRKDKVERLVEWTRTNEMKLFGHVLSQD